MDLLFEGAEIRKAGIGTHEQYETAADWVQRVRTVEFSGPKDPLRLHFIALLFDMDLWRYTHPEEKHYCMECGREYDFRDGAGQEEFYLSGYENYEGLAKINCPACFHAYWKHQQAGFLDLLWSMNPFERKRTLEDLLDRRV